MTLLRVIRLALLLPCLLLPALAAAQSVADVPLVDQHGRDFRLASLHGKVVLLVFGFTHCPHICPVEMARVSAAMALLQDQREQVAAVFITVDPQRDSPGVIGAYTGKFHPDIIGLTGTEQALDLVSGHYRVRRDRQALADGVYLVDHGFSLYVLDRQGEARVAVLPGLPPAHIASLVRDLL